MENLRNAFKNNLALGACTARDVEALGHFADERRVPAREALFAQGERCEHLYFLHSGSIKLFRKDAGGRETVIEFVEPGMSFFEPALFGDRRYALGAEALLESRLLALDAGSLLRYLRTHSHLAASLAAAVSARVSHLVGHIEQLATLSAEQRVAAFLLDNAAAWRERRNGRAPRQTDLARMLAVSPETLCRLIGKFRQRGWVSSNRGRFEVRDAASLNLLLSEGEARLPRARTAGAT